MKILDTFKSIDIYGSPVNVNYRGNSTFPTGFGSLMTLISVILLMQFAGIQLTGILTSDSQEEMTRSVKIDVDEIALDLKENNFSLGFIVLSENGPVVIPKSIGEF